MYCQDIPHSSVILNKCFQSLKLYTARQFDSFSIYVISNQFLEQMLSSASIHSIASVTCYNAALAADKGKSFHLANMQYGRDFQRNGWIQMNHDWQFSQGGLFEQLVIQCYLDDFC